MLLWEKSDKRSEHSLTELLTSFQPRCLHRTAQCPNMSHLKLNLETMELTFISIYKKHLHFTEKQDSYYCKKNLAGFFWESHFSLLISYSDLFNLSFGSIDTLPRYPC